MQVEAGGEKNARSLVNTRSFKAKERGLEERFRRTETVGITN